MIYESKVAIIMSVYKSDKLEHVKESISSIFEQSYQNFTLYIYRDGGVYQQLECYLGSIKNSEKVVYIEGQKNIGLAHALNCLIDIVLDENYEFIFRMDSDDISRKERLEEQLLFMLKNPLVDVSGTCCSEFGSNVAKAEKCLPTSHESLLSFSVTHCPFIHPTVVFRRKVFDSGIRYPTDTSYTEDMALWFKLLSNGFRFANLNKVLLDYRLNENTVKRRQGRSKALSEFGLRWNYMFKLKKFTFKNALLIASRLIFHLLPLCLMEFMYKRCR